MQSSLNIQKINEVPFNLVKVTSVKLNILASKFSVDTRKQSVNWSHFTLQRLPPDCNVDLQNVKCLIYFYLCKGSDLLTPFVCVCACFPRIPRCGRAPPTACTSHRVTRSTARSAAGTFTRKVTGESLKELKDQFWYCRCTFPETKVTSSNCFDPQCEDFQFTIIQNKEKQKILT